MFPSKPAVLNPGPGRPPAFYILEFSPLSHTNIYSLVTVDLDNLK